MTRHYPSFNKCSANVHAKRLPLRLRSSRVPVMWARPENLSRIEPSRKPPFWVRIGSAILQTKVEHDLQHLQNSDERTQRAHLPQEKKMEVRQVRPCQDARAQIGLETPPMRYREARLLSIREGSRPFCTVLRRIDRSLDMQHYRRLFIDRGQRGSQKSSEVARQWIASERGNSMKPTSGFRSGEVL